MRLTLADLSETLRLRNNNGSPGSEMMDRAICLSVRLRRFGNSRKLSSETVEVDADKRLIGVRKQLLEGDELRAITRMDSSILSYVYSRSLPSVFRDGVYLVPTDLIEEVDGKLSEMAREREALVEAFCGVYPTLIEDAASRLRSVFDPRDYPSVESIRDTFGFEWMYLDLSVPSGLKGISRGLWLRESAKQKQLWEDAMTEVRQVLRAQMAALVDHMVDRLSGKSEGGKPRIFRDSLVRNMEDFLSVFDARNITDDADLQALVEKARQVMQGVDPALLREAPTVRAVVARGFERIQSAMDGMMVERPSRAIRFEDE
jgi:hypothetical protein